MSIDFSKEYVEMNVVEKIEFLMVQGYSEDSACIRIGQECENKWEEKDKSWWF